MSTYDQWKARSDDYWSDADDNGLDERAEMDEILDKLAQEGKADAALWLRRRAFDYPGGHDHRLVLRLAKELREYLRQATAS